jgi:hypothetical protein
MSLGMLPAKQVTMELVEGFHGMVKLFVFTEQWKLSKNGGIFQSFHGVNG